MVVGRSKTRGGPPPEEDRSGVPLRPDIENRYRLAEVHMSRESESRAGSEPLQWQLSMPHPGRATQTVFPSEIPSRSGRHGFQGGKLLPMDPPPRDSSRARECARQEGERLRGGTRFPRTRPDPTQRREP